MRLPVSLEAEEFSHVYNAEGAQVAAQLPGWLRNIILGN